MFVVRELYVYIDMLKEIELLCVNIGLEVCVKKEMIVNFFMSLIWVKCLNVIFFLNLVSFYVYV